MDLQLNGKTALVTGGARGLGRAICLALAAEGVHVAVNYRRDAAAARAVTDEIAARRGTRAITLGGDVSRASDVDEVFSRLFQELGALDILVNNAGLWPTDFVQEMSLAAWHHACATNLTGTFLTCRAAARCWAQHPCQGRIVNVSSQAAFRGATTGHAHYAASKAGVVSLTVSLARELAPQGVRVNAVAAGMMRTDMTQETLQHHEEAYLSRIPLRRIADPAEIADAVTFLASDRAAYITGATVDVSGGMLMR